MTTIASSRSTCHFHMMEKPEEFNALLRGFLDKIDF
jgi:hypothetical protein